jgi:hypothetical protein
MNASWAEEAFIEFNHTDKTIHFSGLVVMDQLTESTIITVDRLTIMTQKLGRFCSVNIEAETLDNFFNFVAA